MATVYGFVHHKRFDLISAQDYFEQALAADVVMPQTHQLYSRLMASVGRLEDSLHHAHRARALDPEDVVLISRLAISHYWMNDVERAQQLFELTQDRVDVALPINGLTFALLLVGQERYDDAAQLAKTALANAGAKSDWVDTVFAGLKDPAEEESAVQLVGLMAENELLPPVIQITLWVLFGRIDEAMEIAGRLQHDGEIFEAEILFSPDFRALREHPGFLRLMDDIGVADYWDHVGCEWRDDAVHCQ
jgi:tetratricopeptide (TPR) repeat protein